jgi:hypothetical protein
MDKLQPVIRHHFWILFGIALILPPIAFSMTSGALDEQTQARVEELDKALSSVARGAGSPNGDWANAATQLVNVRKESNRRAWNRLWDAQETLQIWPETVRPYMQACPYRGTPADVPDVSPTDAALVMSAVPNLFRGDYEREIERVWRIPEPIDEQTGLKAEKGAPQKVLFPSTVMPRVPRAKWMAAQPTWKEMWNAQEDLWLMSQLLMAITRTNADAGSIADANVRQIRKIQLFGGERAAAGSSTTPGGAGGMGGSDPGMMAGAPGMMGGLGRAGSTSGTPASADFPLSEEYDVKDAPAGTGGGAYAASMGSGSMGSGMDGIGGASADPASDPQADENRYIKQEWAYRTRGFKLQLTVHQMYVPTLISELLKSEFPLEVIRIQQSALNPDRPGSNRSGGYGGTGFASGGYPGGGGFPGGGLAGSGDPLGSGAGTSLDGADPALDGADGLAADTGSYDPYNQIGGAPSGAAAATNAINSAVVAAALSDVNLVDVVVVGEIYLYNKPEPSEAVEGTDPVAGQAVATEAVTDPGLINPAATAPPTETTVGVPATGLPVNIAQPGTASPSGNPAALTGEVAPPEGSAPATLGTTVIPADGPAGETPAAPAQSSPTPDASEPSPASPAPATEAAPSASVPQQ